MTDSKVGDKVRFMNAVGGGTIVKILDKNQVLVCDDDGFEIPCLASEVLVVNDTHAVTNFPRAPRAEKAQDTHTPNVPQTEPLSPPEESAEPDSEGEDYELLIAFLPPKDEQTELYFLNDSTYQLYYSIGICTAQGKVEPLAHGHVEPDSKIQVKTLFLSKLRERRTLQVEVILFKNIEFLPAQLSAVNLALDPIRFFKEGAFRENDFFDENALIYKLFSSKSAAAKEEKKQEVLPEIEVQKEVEKIVPPAPALPKPEPEKIAVKPEPVVIAPALPRPEVKVEKVATPSFVPSPPKESEKIIAKPVAAKILPNVVEIVDVRANILDTSTKPLSEDEVLQRQLELATTALETALKEEKKCKIVFVYGIGSKRIRQELSILLAKNYPQLYHQDASYKEYHYGAIMVFL